MTLNIISNFAANAALKNLALNGDLASRSVAKLSSGSRVVTAADDAASLAIGSRLNTEVKSLQQAAVNAGQATSLLQTADGALARIQDILTRAKTLAVQAGSQNLGNSERALIDAEFQNLLDEIDRIAADTDFNGAKLVSNSSSAAIGLVGANLTEGQISTGIVNVSARGFRNRALTDGGDGAFTIQVTAGSSGTVASAGQIVFTAVASSTTGSLTFNATISTDLITNVGNTQNGDLLTGTTLNFTRQAIVNTSGTALTTYSQANAELVLSLDETFNVATLFQSGALPVGTIQGSLAVAQNNNGPSQDFTFKVGTGISPSEDTIALQLGGATVENLGLSNAAVTTFSKADSASQAITQALDFVVKIRSDVGAGTNRLDAAAANIATSAENLEAARSRLLDLNVADEITKFTSYQILVQAGISVLAQANQLPQNLLRLYQ
jgi:flagellin